MFAYALFDTAIGRCGIAWGPRGVIGVQLPERNESATRMRLMRHCPNADETDPPKPIQRAIDDIAALLRGEKKSLRAIQLDMSRMLAFNARVYETTRASRRGRRAPMVRSPAPSAMLTARAPLVRRWDAIRFRSSSPAIASLARTTSWSAFPPPAASRRN
jgi:hypothetical protein